MRLRVLLVFQPTTGAKYVPEAKSLQYNELAVVDQTPLVLPRGRSGPETCMDRTTTRLATLRILFPVRRDDGIAVGVLGDLEAQRLPGRAVGRDQEHSLLHPPTVLLPAGSLAGCGSPGDDVSG